MTYWYESPDDQKDPSYWMGECLSYAYTIDLHQQGDKKYFDARKQRLRRRLWWCCYMRDQLVTLSQRKPSRINAEYDVQILELNDYDIEPLGEYPSCPFRNSPAIADVWTRKTMAKLCIEKIKLCICIRHILATHYTGTIVNSARANRANELLVMLTTKQIASDSLDVIKCEQLLFEWNGNLPQDCYLRLRTASDREIPHLEVLSVHRSVLNMLYLTALSAFHRPHIGPQLASPQSQAFRLQQLSLKKVKEAATDIIAIAMKLHKHDSTRFLPPIGVSVLLPALITHLLELKAHPTWRNPSLKLFQQGVQVLQTLRDAFWSADYAFAFIDASVQRVNVELLYGDSKKTV